MLMLVCYCTYYIRYCLVFIWSQDLCSMSMMDLAFSVFLSSGWIVWSDQGIWIYSNTSKKVFQDDNLQSMLVNTEHHHL